MVNCSQWCKRTGAGGTRAPQKFWFDENPRKIPENPGKIHGNLSKICENLRKVTENLGKLSETTGKNGAQVLWFEKMVPNVFRITWRPIWRSSQKQLLWEKLFPLKVAQNFWRKFGEIRAKILRTPKNLPAPTPMILVHEQIEITYLFRKLGLVKLLATPKTSAFCWPGNLYG